MSIVELARLLPCLAALRIDEFISQAQQLLIRATAQTEQATCLACGEVASRVHSSYQRRLVDPPVSGRRAMLELTVRRFFCDNATCARRTFVEQIDGLTTRFGRRTQAAQRLVGAVAFALGGRAGARLMRWLAVPAGRMT
jgi:transposase